MHREVRLEVRGGDPRRAHDKVDAAVAGRRVPELDNLGELVVGKRGWGGTVRTKGKREGVGMGQ